MRDVLHALRTDRSPLQWRYLRALREGTLSRDAFVASQLQFGFAVAHFHRPMAALAARVEGEARAMLRENVADELGHGDPSRAHAETFRVLLRRLGVVDARLDRTSPGRAVSTFNSALDALALGAPLEAYAVLGRIEDAFALISVDVGQSIVARGWLQPSELIHYPAHAELDLHHAEGFWTQLEPLEREPRPRTRAALQHGDALFRALFDGLLEQAAAPDLSR